VRRRFIGSLASRSGRSQPGPSTATVASCVKPTDTHSFASSRTMKVGRGEVDGIGCWIAMLTVATMTAVMAESNDLEEDLAGPPVLTQTRDRCGDYESAPRAYSRGLSQCPQAVVVSGDDRVAKKEDGGPHSRREPEQTASPTSALASVTLGGPFSAACACSMCSRTGSIRWTR